MKGTAATTVQTRDSYAYMIEYLYRYRGTYTLAGENMADCQQEVQQEKKGSTQQKKDGEKKESPAPSKPKRAEAVLKEEELQRVIDLGLGRGVDATNSKPWLNKSSFQVRRITTECVIGTEEGGSLQAYEREVTSVQTQQTDLKASVAIPQSPVTIGVDAEQSRSVTNRRRAVGQKVINRTISFRSDFEDAPVSSTSSPDKARRSALASVSYRSITPDSETADREVTDPNSAATFEERITRWILERVEHRRSLEKLDAAGPRGGASSGMSTAFSGDPMADLAEVIHNSSAEDRKKLLDDCRQFVNHFRITHYVSAIQLGAAEYRVLTETEYYNRIGTAGSLGVESIGSGAVKETVSWKKTSRSSDLKRIGVITEDEKVARGTYDEAVVGVAVQPIVSLVKLRYLQLALRKAILEYISAQGDSSDGPFIIACDNDRMFLTVNTENHTVEATREPGNASLFFIMPNEEGSHAYEFIIAYYGDATTTQGLIRQPSSLTPQSFNNSPVAPLPRYLSAPCSIAGTNPGPLKLKFTAQQSSSRLTLHSRMVKKYVPIDTNIWVQGKEAFFINCARRVLKRDGYICVKRQRQGRLFTACVWGKNLHNERDTWMLFRLLPPSYRNQSLRKPPSRVFSIDPKEHGELHEYEKALEKNTFPLGPVRQKSRSKETKEEEKEGDKPRVRFSLGDIVGDVGEISMDSLPGGIKVTGI